ncbi:hypothetical protein O0I10_004833 [Lichtheimia ornata]|uniref:Iron-binding zinc finger CDGSH type domain-containing protein n=1 Tax=Lichtheimia ornata TaxID=688661 RepID=A0AAD7Y082_9FUNG|nr:uncharacterized protein O0I10_004833 [Lichtheimia ornata]KAJ8659468.1 hypothetical protein O0I10_004833 [Lichtheimia ornata]
MSESKEQQPEPVFVQPKPYKVQLESGKEYYWCTCGQSKNQPFCDGTHRGGPFKPKKITVDETKDYFLCGCKYTHNADGFCDGTHRKEEGIRKYNEFLLKANNKLKEENEALKTKAQLAANKQSMLYVALAAAGMIVVGLAVKHTRP